MMTAVAGSNAADEIVEGWASDEGEPFLEESSFAILFPQYREKYLREIWPNVQQKLSTYGIKADLDLLEGSITIRTTARTRDPYIILKARDMVKLLSRSVPFPKAVEVLEDHIACDIIKIGGFVRNKERFVKRRQRILGPDGNTLKAIELLTKCYVLVQGNTVATVGPYRGLRDVRKIVVDCMNNIHPIYKIKELMIMRELEKDPDLKGQDWKRFLPQFQKARKPGQANQAKKKQKLGKKKKMERAQALFPPPQMPRKEDIMMETGEYWLGKEAVQKKQEKERKEKQQKRKREKEKSYIPPSEGKDLGESLSKRVKT